MLKPPSQKVQAVIHSAGDIDVSLQKINNLVAECPTLGRDLMACTNSRVLGLDREVKSPERAVLLLGATPVQYLAVCHALVRCVPSGDDDLREMMKPFWEDVLRRAVIAQLLGAQQPDCGTEFSFALGLSLEFGSLMLSMDQGRSLVIPPTLRARRGEERREKERGLYGSTHDAVFAEEAAAWGFPRRLVRAAGGHHFRENTDEKVAGWADSLAELFTASDARLALADIYAQMRDEAGMDQPAVDALLEKVPGRVMEAAQIFGVAIPDQVAYSEFKKLYQRTVSPDSMTRDQLLDLVRALQNDQIQLESQRDELREKLTRALNYDPLTGLANRRRFLDSLRREVGRANRYKRDLCLVLVDIDGFTTLNARYGMDAGDELLRRVGKLLGRVVRDADAVSRLGGDEFAIVLPDTRAQGGRVFAERVRAALESLKVDVGEQRILLSGTVVGVSLDALPEDKRNHEAFLHFAVRSLNGYRGRGGNRASWAA